jgi:hypothetical protein
VVSEESVVACFSFLNIERIPRELCFNEPQVEWHTQRLSAARRQKLRAIGYWLLAARY